MNAILLYRCEAADDAVFEFTFYDHTFSPSNLVVRKLLMAMLGSVQERLTHLEVEYNDNMLIEQMGARAGDVLRFLGARAENLREQKSGDLVVSRIFHVELTKERYEHFYFLKDVDQFPHYKLLEGEVERVVFYFAQYLLLRIPRSEEQRFLDELANVHVPYKVIDVNK